MIMEENLPTTTATSQQNRAWPDREGPREKLLRRGAAALTDAELLALFLRTGSRGQNVMQMAGSLLDRHGGLAGLVDASSTSLMRSTPGLGPAKYSALSAVMELARRYLASPLQRHGLCNNPQAVRTLLSARLRGEPLETFLVLFLDNRLRLIADEVMFRGTIDQTAVHPRAVVQAAMRHNAAAVILAHNHPSGVAEPSHADRDITMRLRDALAMVDVRVVDHCVVGAGEVISLAERGWV